MRKLLFLLLFCLPVISNAQDVAINNADGVFLTYTLTKVKEDAKKDVYLVSCRATNKNDYDVYYEAPANNVNPFLSTISIRTSNDEIYLTGNQSKLSSNGRILYYIKKGSSVSAEKEIKVNKGVTPVITGKFVSEVKNISDFR